MNLSSTEGPLWGIRILDFTRLYPGPLATMMLADMGAEVIKIEDPRSPDAMRFYPPYIEGESAGYPAVNRSKRSLAIHLRSTAGKDIFFKLLPSADVVIEPFRPGVIDSMELGYEKARSVKPDIIYVSLTGYGQKGPYSRQAGHDINFIGYSGILAATGAAQTGPVIPAPQLGDIAGGAYMAVIATLAALAARTRTGRGQKVDVSMLDGLMPLMALQMAHAEATQTVFAPGEAPLSGGLACYGVYRCSDGKYMALGILEEKFWKTFCDLADRRDWKERFLVHGAEAETLRKEIAALFLTKTREEWTEIGLAADICLTPVLDIDEAGQDPHIRARGMIVDKKETGEKIQGVGVPIKFSQTPARPKNAAPALGADTAAILREIGYSSEEIAAFEKDGIILTAANP